jgi:hypothetical protein
MNKKIVSPKIVVVLLFAFAAVAATLLPSAVVRV